MIAISADIVNTLFVIASEAKQSQTAYGIASSLTLLAMTVELFNNLYQITCSLCAIILENGSE